MMISSSSQRTLTPYYSHTLSSSLKKAFCKHVGKALMVIPEDKAIAILRKMGSERDKWEFRPYVA